MKKFGKKILALFMALMCIATIGVVSASARSVVNSGTYKGVGYTYYNDGSYARHYRNGSYDVIGGHVDNQGYAKGYHVTPNGHRQPKKFSQLG